MQNLSFQFAMQKLKYVATNKALYLIFCNAISQFFNDIFFRPPVGQVIVCKTEVFPCDQGTKVTLQPKFAINKNEFKSSKVK